jgi:hypothetical protein
MATVIDITGKIKNEEKFIVYNGKSYKVDDRKNTIIQVYSIIDNANGASIEMIDKVMEILLGKAAVKDFDGFAYDDYLVPFFAAMACVQNKSYDEVEASFRKTE